MDAGSTFAERFAFSRVVQAHAGKGEDDQTFAAGIGVNGSAVTDYKRRNDPPPAERAYRIAVRCGVDAGWLVFGVLTKAPAPPGFDQWLVNRRGQKKPPATAVKAPGIDRTRPAQATKHPKRA